MAWWRSALDTLAWFFEKELIPGTKEHREALLRSMKERNDELAKPPAQRDPARLLDLSKRVLRLRIGLHRFKKQELFKHRDIWLKLRSAQDACCADCNRVRQRAAASCAARAAWHATWELVCTLRLQALVHGQPYPPLVLPCLELELPEGLPEELPPSIDRCATCQQTLDQYLYLEQRTRATVDTNP